MAVKLLTTGELARRLDVAPRHVRHLVLACGIRHVALAGRARLFDNAALARLRHEVKARRARACAAGGGPVL